MAETKMPEKEPDGLEGKFDLPGNSNKSKSTTQKAVAKATGTKDNSLAMAGQYVWNDILVPAFKRAISDAVSSGLDILLFGATDRNRNRGATGYTNYTKAYTGSGYSQNQYSYSSTTRSSARQPATPQFSSREEAEDVLERMEDILETYGEVTVADLYELSGLEAKYTDNQYGWRNLSTARIVMTRKGWIIELPRTIALLN